MDENNEQSGEDIEFDWDAEDDSTKQFAELEAGDHMATLEKAESKKSKNKGTPFLNIWWRLANNRIVFQSLYLTQNTTEWFIGDMDKLGIKGALKELKNNTDAILTKAAQLLTDKEIHAEIFVSYRDDGQFRNQDVKINEAFEGPMRDDGLLNKAPLGDSGVTDSEPSFNADEELPF